MSLQTQKKEYLRARNYCSINGFKFVSTENQNRSIISVYRNKYWEIEFEAFSNKTEDGNEATSYFIKLTKP